MNSKNIVIIGAGSWGTALGIMLAEQHSVTLWEYNSEQAERLKRERVNTAFLPNIPFPDTLAISHDIAVSETADIIVIAVPSQAVRQVCTRLAPHIRQNHIIASVVKGIENSTFKRMSEIINEVCPPHDATVVISGPSHAEEVARQLPTAVVVAGTSKNAVQLIQTIFTTPYFRLYANYDIIGTELCGSLKNIIAIAAGIADGLHLGANAKSALMTRGMAEIRRFGIAFNAHESTFSGLAGIGDLITTCISPFSRNRYVGEQCAAGKTLDDILKTMNMVAEGVTATKNVHQRADDHSIEMPVTDAVYCILFENKPPAQALEELMTRSQKEEIQ